MVVYHLTQSSILICHSPPLDDFICHPSLKILLLSSLLCCVLPSRVMSKSMWISHLPLEVPHSTYILQPLLLLASSTCIQGYVHWFVTICTAPSMILSNYDFSYSCITSVLGFQIIQSVLVSTSLKLEAFPSLLKFSIQTIFSSFLSIKTNLGAMTHTWFLVSAESAALSGKTSVYIISSLHSWQ